MEQLDSTTSLDAFLAFGYSREFEEHLVSSDLILPPAGRGYEPLTGNWFFASDLNPRWNMENPAEAPLSHPDPKQFMQWQSSEMLEHCDGPGTLIFARTVPFRQQHEGERVFLRFGNIGCPAVFFLNDKCIACHGGNTRTFSVEVTGQLQEENLLVVAMGAAPPRPEGPSEKTSVALVRTQPIAIDSWKLVLDPRYENRALSLDLWLSSCCPKTLRMEIPELGIGEDLHVSNGHVHAIIQAEPEVWTEENPKTYDVRFTWDDCCLSDKVAFKVN